MPRLSVDIDLNYVGATDREIMLAERPKVEQAIQAVCSRENFSVRRVPTDHAGGKWMLRYEKVAGQGGNLEVDVNFMFRVPLWPVKTLDSHTLGSYHASGIQVLDIHELAAGKLATLLARQQARDLFDAHQLLHFYRLDRQRLRLAFVVYGAMNRKDWRTVSTKDVGFDARDLARELLPLLRTQSAACRWPGTRSTGTRSSILLWIPRHQAIAGLFTLGPLLFPSSQFLAPIYFDLLLDRHHDRWTVSPEPLVVQMLNELRERHFPWLLILVGELPELLRVKTEFARHLDLCVGQLELPPCIYPDL